MYKVAVLSNEVGSRVDVFLAGKDGIPTRSAAQKLIADGCVYINSTPVRKNSKVCEGDIITCNLPSPIPSEAVAEDIPLDIVYEDDQLLVVNKSRGMVVHPAAGNWSGTLVNALLHHCDGSLSGIGGVLRPGIVHRLDKDTSGLMVVAKSDAAHQGLAAQLASRTMKRVYRAVCFGVPKPRIRIDAPIGRHPVDRKKMAILVDSKSAREAVTYVELLEDFGRFALVSAKLETGRTHQIRVHMAHIGHPVLGDTVYGNRTQPKFLENVGQILHAHKISFAHPVTGEEMEFESVLPEYFLRVVENVVG